MASRSVEEHRTEIERYVLPIGDREPEHVPLDAALGRTLAADVAAPLDLPVFRNSQMDGYALDAATLTGVPVSLPVLGTIAAGDSGAHPVPAGAAVRIMTGAPIPPGVDCVVPVEDTEASDSGELVTIRRARKPGEFVREPGSDIVTGQLLAGASTVLAPRHIAALAAVGVGSVPVRRRPRVAVLTTGAELVAAGTTLGPGQIYDSNGIALSSSLRANGAETVSVARSTDDPVRFRELLRAASAGADAVVTSGGVSMGDFEVVKETLAPLGGFFGHVAMQPGGPQGLSVFEGTPVLSFPGNPVSTLVSFEVLLRPVLRRVAGLPANRPRPSTLARNVQSAPGRRQFLRGRLVEDTVEPVSGPGSHLVAMMSRADVLIDIPAEVTALDAGDAVQVWDL